MAYEGGSARGAVRKGGSGVIKGGAARDSPVPTEPVHPMDSGRSHIGMWWRGGTVGWLGKMPISSHHWACTPCH